MAATLIFAGDPRGFVAATEFIGVVLGGGKCVFDGGWWCGDGSEREKAVPWYLSPLELLGVSAGTTFAFSGGVDMLWGWEVHAGMGYSCRIFSGLSTAYVSLWLGGCEGFRRVWIRRC